MDNAEQAQETQNTETPEVETGTVDAPEDEKQEGAGSEGTEDVEAKEGEALGADKAEEEAPVDDAKAEGQHKRSGGYVRKIERLERQLEQALALAKPPQQGVPPAKDKTPTEQAADFVKNLVSEQLAAERESQRQQAQFSELQRRMDEARGAHADFDEALEDAAHIRLSDGLHHALLTSEQGPEIMYQLAKNKAELARLSALPPLDAAREVGRLEAKFASGAAPQKPKPAARPPAPPSKVGGSASSTRSLEDLPISEYKRAYRSGRR